MACWSASRIPTHVAIPRQLSSSCNVLKMPENDAENSRFFHQVWNKSNVAYFPSSQMYLIVPSQCCITGGYNSRFNMKWTTAEPTRDTPTMTQPGAAQPSLGPAS